MKKICRVPNLVSSHEHLAILSRIFVDNRSSSKGKFCFDRLEVEKQKKKSALLSH